MNSISYSGAQETLRIQKAGSYEISLDGCQEFSLHIEEEVEATLYLSMNKSELVKVNLDVAQGAKLNLLHHFHQEVNLQEIAMIHQDASLSTGFYVLETLKMSVNAKYHLKASEAKVSFISSTISNSNTEYDIECIHESPFTTSQMENYAISKEMGNYKIIASGKINKGAHGSKSHQSTRVLTMGEKQNASVTPLLLIDENDVEASHASAIGSMNEDHLYYLQTRGLNQNQALGLLTLSYILPILKIVENTDFYDRVKEEIESKVGIIC